MRLTILTENTVMQGLHYYGEHGVSFYIEDGDTKILLDTGYSGVFLENAKKMGIDLGQLDVLAISHGHDDHIGGLGRFYGEGLPQNLRVVAHPEVFADRYYREGKLSPSVTEAELREKCELILTRQPMMLSDHIVYLGQIPRLNDFEHQYAMGQKMLDGNLQDDFITDDTALAYCGKSGLYIITGCSHSGICNIAEYAKQVCGDQRIAGIIGGFHLFEEGERLEGTIHYFLENQVEKLYPCHCTSFQVRARINRELPICDAGVGLTLDWE